MVMVVAEIAMGKTYAVDVVMVEVAVVTMAENQVISLENSPITVVKMEDVVLMMTIIENVANVAVRVVCQETVVVDVVDRRRWSVHMPTS